MRSMPNSRLDAFYQQHPQMAPAPPDERIAAGAQHYARSIGLPQEHRNFGGVEVNARRGRAIAAEYARLPEYDRGAEPSFEAMRVETGRQFEFMTGHGKGRLGLDVSVQHDDPYGSPGEMRADVREGRLKVLSTRSTGGHPYFSDDENDQFRAVHDVFGHAGTGRGFDRHGEEAAWQKHSQMYTPLARRAMTTETRGQNSSIIFGQKGFDQPQKIGLLSPQFSTLTPVVGRKTAGRPPGKQFK